MQAILVAVSPETAEPARSAELRPILSGSTWFVGVLETVREVGPPGWWIGAGVIRDVVWERRFSAAAEELRSTDVDVAFFDGGDLSREREQLVQSELDRRRPDVAWDAKNQAAVHVWYPDRSGGTSRRSAQWPRRSRHGRNTRFVSLRGWHRAERSRSARRTVWTISSMAFGGAIRRASRSGSTSGDWRASGQHHAGPALG